MKPKTYFYFRAIWALLFVLDPQLHRMNERLKRFMLRGHLFADMLQTASVAQIDRLQNKPGKILQEKVVSSRSECVSYVS